MDNSIRSNPYKIHNFALPSIQSNKLPTKEEAQKTFWGLGDQFWKQIIDGNAHQFGPLVFDQGLHRGDVEPGFFASMKRGCEFASEKLGEPLSVSFYKDLHKTLCAHFKGRENSTIVTSEDTGKFLKHSLHINHDFKRDSKFAQEQFRIIEYKESLDNMSHRIAKIIDQFTPEEKFEHDADIAAYPEAKAWVEKWEADLITRHENLKDEMDRRFQELGIAPYCEVRCLLPDYPIYVVKYLHCPPEAVEQIVHLLFDRYNRVIEETHSRYKNCSKKEDLAAGRSETITAIADLYQMLEWLHPFADGQGRTDLVLLTKLLTEQGLTPAILDDPYVSSWSGLAYWKAYIEDGMAKWQEARLDTVK